VAIQLLDAEKADVTHPAEDTVAVHTEVLIDAPEKVWAVLTDFERLSECSNTLVGMEGAVGYHMGHQLALGARQSYVEFNRRLNARVESM